jgi:predicted heme/steroid binding protein
MKKVVVVLLAIILVFNISFLIFYKPTKVTDSELRKFTPTELKKYDGSDPNLPIYLAYNGDVYDITPGKKFYIVGGPYHDLAGKDSTKELNFAGGGIIKIKYKIIGKLVN